MCVGGGGGGRGAGRELCLDEYGELGKGDQKEAFLSLAKCSLLAYVFCTES